MSTELQTALIAGVGALIAAGVTGYLAWQQIQRERSRWLYDVKTTLSMELYRKRMEEYAKLSTILIGLSTRNQPKLTIARAHALGDAMAISSLPGVVLAELWMRLREFEGTWIPQQLGLTGEI